MIPDGAGDIQIVPYTNQYAQEVTALAGKAVGEQTMTGARLAEIAGRRSFFYIALANGALVGYSCLLDLAAKEVAERLQLPAMLLQAYANTQGRVCYIDSIGVAAASRRQGAGAALFEPCLRDAQAGGLSSAWGCVPKNEEDAPIRAILSKSGFKMHSEIPLLWNDQRNYVCRVCGGRCRCAGAIFYRSLKG
jgi:ribosomal protein S18 acetylase RimI-like enzyme